MKRSYYNVSDTYLKRDWRLKQAEQDIVIRVKDMGFEVYGSVFTCTDSEGDFVVSVDVLILGDDKDVEYKFHDANLCVCEVDDEDYELLL